MATTNGPSISGVDALGHDGTTFAAVVRGMTPTVLELGQLSSVREVGSHTVVLDNLGRACLIIPTANLVALVASREDTP